MKEGIRINSSFYSNEALLIAPAPEKCVQLSMTVDIITFLLSLLEHNPVVRNTRRRSFFNSRRQTLYVNPIQMSLTTRTKQYDDSSGDKREEQELMGNLPTRTRTDGV